MKRWSLCLRYKPKRSENIRTVTEAMVAKSDELKCTVACKFKGIWMIRDPSDGYTADDIVRHHNEYLRKRE